jgi:predicted nucleic acid-binding protein
VEIGTSVIVLAKIRRGIDLERRRDPDRAKSLDRWFAQVRTRLGDRVLPIYEPIAQAWVLPGIPHPVPLIDGLLAATANVHGVALLIRNVADIPAPTCRFSIRFPRDGEFPTGLSKINDLSQTTIDYECGGKDFESLRGAPNSISNQRPRRILSFCSSLSLVASVSHYCRL